MITVFVMIWIQLILVYSQLRIDYLRSDSSLPYDAHLFFYVISLLPIMGFCVFVALFSVNIAEENIKIELKIGNGLRIMSKLYGNRS